MKKTPAYKIRLNKSKADKNSSEEPDNKKGGRAGGQPRAGGVGVDQNDYVRLPDGRSESDIWNLNDGESDAIGQGSNFD